jgi:hypothetical protein
MSGIGLGNVKISQLSVGGIDLTNSQTYAYAFNIYEDIFDVYGPKAEIRVHDYVDALGNNRLNGSYEQDVVISLSEYYTGGRLSMNFKLYQNADMNDRAGEEGSGRMKEYDLRCVMPELLNAQGNIVNKSYVDFTTNITKDILTNNFKTTRAIEIQEQSANNRRFNFNQKHPKEVIKILNDEHIGTESKSSAFITYQNHRSGSSRYRITTFEKLFQQAAVVGLTRSSTTSFSTATLQDMINSIRTYQINSAFFTRDRAQYSTVSRSFNLSTGVLHDQSAPSSLTFKVLGKPAFNSEASYVSTNKPSETTFYDNVNDPQNITLAQARANRKQFLSFLTENHGTFEIHGNPNITLGDVVNLTIPNQSAQGGSQERLFSGPALVVSIQHRIAPIDSQPRYTMVLGLVKAGFNQYGGGAA